ncbi:MAG: hypothetical protein CVV27_14280 [Candidatus Melainabacteria bacterium HGW-Melainabacteria-1]|nr:MAG: hypothetical protein CVV27_14280 [Candidatus Melainabacteria bacterium HGW-Melainabacteria-1]
MLLKAVSRSDYRLYREAAGLAALAERYPQAWLIPEGGSNPQALTGLAQIISMLPAGTKTLALACGTATTLAGLAAAAPVSVSVLGVAVLPRADFLRQHVQNILAHTPVSPWRIETDFSMGGYARSTPELDDFLSQFSGLNPEVPLEPVYTGKLLYAVTQMLKANELDANGLVLLHTGGLPLGLATAT